MCWHFTPQAWIYAVYQQTGSLTNLPEEEADFVGAFKNQDTSRGETQGIFSSIPALNTQTYRL